MRCCASCLDSCCFGMVQMWFSITLLGRVVLVRLQALQPGCLVRRLPGCGGRPRLSRQLQLAASRQRAGIDQEGPDL